MHVTRYLCLQARTLYATDILCFRVLEDILALPTASLTGLLNMAITLHEIKCIELVWRHLDQMN